MVRDIVGFWAVKRVKNKNSWYSNPSYYDKPAYLCSCNKHIAADL